MRKRAPVHPKEPSISQRAAKATKWLEEGAKILSKASEGVTGTTTKYPDQINETRCLLVKIRYQDALQTPSVSLALYPVIGIIERIFQMLGNENSSEELPNAMTELQEATSNLESQLPGERSIANNNKLFGGFQSNALFDGSGRGSERRLNTEASGNLVRNGFQTNAPTYGNPTAMAELFRLFSPGIGK
ncbi:hypothetical protein P280DRAFT_333085 [Massarina eburnea CBS 473.64]|uniref:Uncharacterized protein n=1 Tax=Massarina eburnea CBS 473.64 TaxID=1395130 RepID=A0A6A6S2L9_9PLEO|nr:hypothetical protein P280DRAFT_333085 [Massarina eburnea CBS 473.64]